MKVGNAPNGPKTIVNAAVTLSAMRQLMKRRGFAIDIPDVPIREVIPPVEARIVLGGKDDEYSGFVPGVFEEMLATLEKERPTYLLGGLAAPRRSWPMPS